MAVAPAVIEAKKPAAAEPPEKKPEVIFLSLRGKGVTFHFISLIFRGIYCAFQSFPVPLSEESSFPPQLKTAPVGGEVLTKKGEFLHRLRELFASLED